MSNEPGRGELWWVDWSPGRGSEQTGLRPALVVQHDAANSNANYPNTIVATISTKGRPVTTHIALTPSRSNGLTEKSFVKCEQLMTISKQRLSGRMGRLARDDQERVNTALRKVLAL